MPVHLQIVEDAVDVARAASQHVCAQVRERSDAVLGLATGSTPEATYAELVQLYRERALSLARVRSVNLDEYCGLDGAHEQSYRHYMQTHLFDRVNIRPWNTLIPDGLAADREAECRAYEERIRALGGVDLWLLGIGSNGHIAFNEPGSSCDSRTRCVQLTAETIADNSRLFAASTEVPRRAFTVGVGTILEARRVLLLATGAHKARAVAAALQGDQGAHCPASFLREHAHCTFVIDRPAASMLES